MNINFREKSVSINQQGQRTTKVMGRRKTNNHKECI